MQSPRLAFSYIRFSSEKQHLGDSLRRQLALAESYAASHNMVLDTDTYRDMGISAFKGRNSVEGKLAMFLRAVDANVIPAQAYLLVESLDRLSRSDVDEALSLFLSIIKRGVTIVTVADGHEYSTETIKRDRGISLIISITVMMRAHEESSLKSQRCTAAWQARTERGGILTKRCPSWIIHDNGKWRIDRKRAAVVRRIFRMYLLGLGCYTIHRALNEAAVPVMQSAKFWTHGIVTRILRNPAVYGTMERRNSPDVENYYPAIVSRPDYERAQMLAKSRGSKGERHGVHPSNLFFGMSFCAGCGTRMHLVSGVDEVYGLMCGRANARAGCSATRVPSRAAEKALLEELLAPKHLLPVVSPAWTEAIAAIKKLEAAQTNLQTKREKLIQLALASQHVAPVAKRIAEVERALNDGLAELAVQRRVAFPKRSNDLSEARSLCAALVSGFANSTERLAMREKLKALTRRLFARIEFHPSLPELHLLYESGVQALATYVRRPSDLKDAIDSLGPLPVIAR